MSDFLQLNIRPTIPADHALVSQFIKEQWGDTLIVSRGKLHQPAALPGFIAEDEGRLLGVVTYHLDEDACEIVTIDAMQQFHGVGTLLLDAVVAAARAASCQRLWLITTNDNLSALRFYQRRGFVLAALHRDAIAESRKIKPTIPLIGMNNIPIRDEIELEMKLQSQ